MKKRWWIFIILLLVVSIGVTSWYYKPIGTVEGPEWNLLHIDGVTYVCESGAGFDIPYDRSDRGRHLGIIKSGDRIFHIYEIKGDPERNYLYWSWEWEGDVYVRKEIADAAKEPEIPISEFSYAQVLETYQANDPGVKTEGFHNASSSRYSGVEGLIELAKSECTIGYDSVSLAYDSEELIMRVSFYTEETIGNCQDVFIDNTGKTILIIYCE